jgi:hypothetical protein
MLSVFSSPAVVEIKDASPTVHPFTAASTTARHGCRAPKGGATVNGRLFKGGQFCLPYDPANPHGVEATPGPVAAPAAAPVKTSINGFTYKVTEIDPGECGTVAFSMHRTDTNHRYDIIRNFFGEVTCDCPDFEFRRAGTGKTCKHGQKLVELGMVPAPSPVKSAEVEAPFDGRALYAYARDRRAIPAVAAFGRANGFPKLIINWSVAQATATYFEFVEAVEGMVIS